MKKAKRKPRADDGPPPFLILETQGEREFYATCRRMAWEHLSPRDRQAVVFFDELAKQAARAIIKAEGGSK